MVMFSLSRYMHATINLFTGCDYEESLGWLMCKRMLCCLVG